MSTKSRLRIATINVLYLLPEGHPSPQGVAGALNEIVRKELPAALRSMLAAALPADDQSVWFIRCLDVALDINAAWEPEQIARSWARQFTRSLAPDLCGAGDCTNVIRFRDRAAYLARFIVDVASGNAWDHWVYKSYAGLRALPASAAIRSALLDDPARGRVALQGLHVRELGAVACSLANADALHLLDQLAGPGTAAPLDDALMAAMLALWRSVEPHCDLSSAPRSALVLFARSGAADPTKKVAASTIASLATFIAHHTAVDQAHLLLALARGDMSAVRHIAGSLGGALAPLAKLSGTCLDAVFRTLATPKADWTEGPRYLRFGGALLLMRFLDALPLEMLFDWPPFAQICAAQALRWLVLVKCAGQSRADATFRDPLLRDLLGVAPTVSWCEVAAWLAALGEARREAFATALGRDVACVEVDVRDRGELLTMRIDPDGYWRALSPGSDVPASDTEQRSIEIERDLDYLALPEGTGVPPSWDRALGIAAQQLLRGFARRLPGFAASGCAFLHQNFLDFFAAIEFEPARLVARLGRPPLDLMLALTGINRGAIQQSWLDERPLALFGEE